MRNMTGNLPQILMTAYRTVTVQLMLWKQCLTNFLEGFLNPKILLKPLSSHPKETKTVGVKARVGLSKTITTLKKKAKRLTWIIYLKIEYKGGNCWVLIWVYLILEVMEMISLLRSNKVKLNKFLKIGKQKRLWGKKKKFRWRKKRKFGRRKN